MITSLWHVCFLGYHVDYLRGGVFDCRWYFLLLQVLYHLCSELWLQFSRISKICVRLVAGNKAAILMQIVQVRVTIAPMAKVFDTQGRIQKHKDHFQKDDNFEVLHFFVVFIYLTSAGLYIGTPAIIQRKKALSKSVD
ncbi:hypothetical protein P8452_55168 [Trifolium repens]|nr:hypothetical protein P8452_55168 [Trifolium repens]